MHYLLNQAEAILCMNAWGKSRTPFLFIIDFEMKAIRLFRSDRNIPASIRYDFGSENPSGRKPVGKKVFSFLKFPVSFSDYQLSFDAVMKQIHLGNTYLTNLTFPTCVKTSLALNEIFDLSEAKYKLLVDGEFVCFSPETFIKISEGIISTFPMKGTIKTSVSMPEETILSDSKEEAEHNTIVDLLRNDLSRVASSVKVDRFRYIDRLKTHEGELLQVSSEISGLLPQGFHSRLGDIIFAMLPAGSVTGAPKEKTVSIIREIENADRGYYTGVCGIFDGNNLDSAVMIRFIEIHNGTIRFRSGGGITFLSRPEAEYNELIDKVYVPIA
jgi:para-aminobenzoate synthetase component I